MNKIKLTDKELKELPKSTIRRLQIQRGGDLKDIPWQKAGDVKATFSVYSITENGM